MASCPGKRSPGTTAPVVRGRPVTKPLMATNIYVGNLPWGATTDDLVQLFAPYGTVEKTQIITDRETGRSRGFGFVEMSSEEDANKAIEALNNSPYSGRPLTVNIAKPRESRSGGEGNYGGGGGGRSGGGGGYGGGGGGYGGGGGDRY